MNIIEFRDFYRSELEKTNKESDYIFKILLKELCNIDPLKIALDPNFIIKTENEMLLRSSLKIVTNRILHAQFQLLRAIGSHH